MKKNFLKNLCILLSISFVFTACASNNNDTAASDGGDSSATSGTETAGANAVETGLENMAGRKTVYGEISEVIGNALVIKEIERPQGRMFTPGEGGMPEGMEIPTGEDGRPDFSQMQLPEGMELPEGMTEEDFRERMNQMGERAQNGGMPGQWSGEITEGGTFDGGVMSEGRTFNDGAMPEGAFPGGAGENPAAGRTAEPAYTGTEIEVIIPVGTPVKTYALNDENVMEEQEISLNDVSTGDTVTIVYTEDETAVESVTVSQAGTVGGGMMMPGGDGAFFFEWSDGGMPPGGAMPGEVFVTEVNVP
jgi:hypothetical protein